MPSLRVNKVTSRSASRSGYVRKTIASDCFSGMECGSCSISASENEAGSNYRFYRLRLCCAKRPRKTIWRGSQKAPAPLLRTRVIRLQRTHVGQKLAIGARLAQLVEQQLHSLHW